MDPPPHKSSFRTMTKRRNNKNNNSTTQCWTPPVNQTVKNVDYSYCLLPSCDPALSGRSKPVGLYNSSQLAQHLRGHHQPEDLDRFKTIVKHLEQHPSSAHQKVNLLQTGLWLNSLRECPYCEKCFVSLARHQCESINRPMRTTIPEQCNNLVRRLSEERRLSPPDSPASTATEPLFDCERCEPIFRQAEEKQEREDNIPSITETAPPASTDPQPSLAITTRAAIASTVSDKITTTFHDSLHSINQAHSSYITHSILLNPNTNPTFTSSIRQLQSHHLTIHPNLDPTLPTAFDIANHPHLYRKVPYQAILKWRSLAATLFRQYSNASVLNNSKCKTESLIRLLSLPAMALVQAYRGGKKNRRKQVEVLNTRMNNLQLELGHNNPTAFFSSSTVTNVLQDPTMISQRQQIINATSANAVCDQLTRNAQRAKRYIADGYLGRASRALIASSGDNTLTEQETINRLKELHPQRASSTLPPQPPTTTTCIIDPADPAFLKLVKESANGSAPGLSGWTGEMLAALIEEPDCMKGLALLVSDITNGDLPPESKPYLLSSRLVTLPKPNSDIRPIAVGEMFYRLAAMRAQSLVTSTAAGLLQPIQFGVAISDGCGIAVHTIQHALEQTNFPVAALAVDFRNAFNERSRADVLSALYKEQQLESVWKICNFAYSEPSLLWIRDRATGLLRLEPDLSSSEGVRQGDPIALLLFCLAMKDIYSTALQQGVSSNSDSSAPVHAVAIADDFTVLGKPEALIRVYLALERLAAEGGLHVQPNKSQFIYFHQQRQPLSTEVQEFIQQRGIVLQETSTVLLGAPIGRSSTDIEEQVENLVSEQCEFFNAILHPDISNQEAFLLLRVCGVPRLNYLLRTVRPRAIQKAVGRYDEQMFKGAFKKLNIFVPDSEKKKERRLKKRLALPVKAGGFGLTPSRERTNIAWFSSITNTLQHNGSYWQSFFDRYPNYFLALGGSQSSSSTDNFALLEQLQDSLRKIRSQTQSEGGKLNLPRTIEEFPSYISNGRWQQHGGDESSNNNNNNPSSSSSSSSTSHRRHQSISNNVNGKSLQHQLSEAAVKQNINALRVEAEATNDKFEIALLNSTSVKDAGRWLTVVPSQPEFELRNPHFETAAKIRLGIKPADTLLTFPNRCPLCHRPTHIDDVLHCLSCIAFRRNSITFRHDLVVSAINSYAHRSCITTEVEPRRLSIDSRKKPDLKLFIDNTVTLADITVRHPTAVSHLSTSASAPLATLKAAEREKTRKYCQMAKENNAKFIPFAVETYGAIGDGARELIRLIANAAYNSSAVYSAKTIEQGLLSAVAIAVQRGNAIVINEAMRTYHNGALNNFSINPVLADIAAAAWNHGNSAGVAA